MAFPAIMVFAALQAASVDPYCAAEASDQSLIENVNGGVLVHLRIKGRAAPTSGANRAPVNRDGYERLMVRFVTCAQNAGDANSRRNYRVESRGWVKRLFSRKLVGKVLKVTATVNPLGVSSSKPLITVTRDSGKSGDVWITDVGNDLVLLPYFRIGDNQSVKLDIAFTSTRNYNISAAGTAIDIVKRAATLLNPTGSLVTSLNKDQFNQTADFIDRTIEGLLTVSIQEQVHTENQLDDSSNPLTTMTLYAPWANDVFPNAAHALQPLGRWEIYAEPLNGDSIFDLRSSDGRMSDYSAPAIMNFRVTEDQTLKQAVTGDSSVQQARDTLLSAETGQATTDAAWTLCRAAALRIDSLGFSAADTGRSVWAYLTDLSLATNKRSDASTACAQLDHWPSGDEIAAIERKPVVTVRAKFAAGHKRH